MSIVHAIVLGVVQGLTEFFPVSSSGHLALVPWLFGWDDFGDNESLAKAFDVALHLGTTVGAIAYLRHDLLRFLKGGLQTIRGRSFAAGGRDGRMAWLLLLTTLPAAITGVALNDTIERLDDEIGLIAVMLIVGGLVLLWADRLGGTRTQADFGVRDAVLMGIGQALALQPGVSRSGVTMTVGRWLRFDRDTATRVSFLMSIPVIAGAGLFSAVDVNQAGGVPSDFYAPFAVGALTSAITGWFAVWFTIRLVRTRTLSPFVVYRVVVGLAVLGLLAAGFG